MKRGRGGKKNSKINKINKDIFNKKIIIILAVTAVILIGLSIIFKNLAVTTKVVEAPPSPENCSNEMVRQTWESIFQGSSDNLTIVAAPTDLNETNYPLAGIFFIKGCPFYSIYQLNGTKLKALAGINMWFLVDINMIYAINGEFKPEKMNNITSLLTNFSQNPYSNISDPETNFTQIDLTIQSIATMGLENNDENNSLLPRNISSIDEANSEFESVFKANSSNWTIEEENAATSGSELVTDEQNTTDYNSSENITIYLGQQNTTDYNNIANITIYSFNESEDMENFTLFGETINPQGEIINSGIVFQNSSLDEYIVGETSVFGILKYLGKKFENWTSPINTSLTNITINVNDSRLKISNELNPLLEHPSGIQKVEILENNETLILTEVNLSDNFDWTKIILKKQDINSSRGYLIVNGLNYTKNVTIDKLNNESDSVCVKDKEIDSINEISDTCNSSDEYLLKCPENFSNNEVNLTCEILGNKFFVTGLEHSAVVEMLPAQAVSCTPNWACTDWSDYTKECGYRTCTDSNNCNNISTKPTEDQECPVCTPNWQCTNFLPEKCPKSQERTRTCSDLNNCETSQGEPEISETCQRNINSGIWIAVGIGIGIIILLITILIIKGNKREFKENEEYPEENSKSEEQYEPKKKTNNTTYKKSEINNNDDEYYYPKDN